MKKPLNKWVIFGGLGVGLFLMIRSGGNSSAPDMGAGQYNNAVAQSNAATNALTAQAQTANFAVAQKAGVENTNALASLILGVFSTGSTANNQAAEISAGRQIALTGIKSDNLKAGYAFDIAKIGLANDLTMGEHALTNEDKADTRAFELGVKRTDFDLANLAEQAREYTIAAQQTDFVNNMANKKLDSDITAQVYANYRDTYITAPAQAKAASKGKKGGLLKGAIMAVGAVAAPFTGGTSLAAATAATNAMNG